MKQSEYAALVAQMAHGILCACSSPQFAARLDMHAKPPVQLPDAIAAMARETADAVICEAVKQGRPQRKRR